jgi:hypothetical protein
MKENIFNSKSRPARARVKLEKELKEEYGEEFEIEWFGRY